MAALANDGNGRDVEMMEAEEGGGGGGGEGRGGRTGRCVLELMPSDVLLEIFSFFAVAETAAMGATDKRSFFLLHRLAKIEPELVAVRGDYEGRPGIADALRRIRAKPNILIGFHSYRSPEEVETNLLPPEACFCIANNLNIQMNSTDYFGHELGDSLLLGSFPEATFVSFKHESSDSSSPTDSILKSLKGGDWKVFIIFSCGSAWNSVGDTWNSMCETVHELQKAFPDAAICGGICDNGSISNPRTASEMSVRELKKAIKASSSKAALKGITERRELVELYNKVVPLKVRSTTVVSDGIFGVAMGGNVPVRSIVSRGVRSLSSGKVAASSDFVISSSTHIPPENAPANLVNVMGGNCGFHVVRAIRGRGSEYNGNAFLSAVGRSESILGIETEDGFRMQGSPLMGDGFFILTDDIMGSESLEGKQIDVFAVDPQACEEDLEFSLQKLSENLRNEKLLGALMFSCAARGPSKMQSLSQDMMDARAFASKFPQLPLCGGYLGGEIGPVALGGARGNIFRAGQAELQGFTAVFAVFIVPQRSKALFKIDDSAENIDAYMRQRYTNNST
eukprot:g4314.t1